MKRRQNDSVVTKQNNETFENTEDHMYSKTAKKSKDDKITIKNKSLEISISYNLPSNTITNDVNKRLIEMSDTKFKKTSKKFIHILSPKSLNKNYSAIINKPNRNETVNNNINDKHNNYNFLDTLRQSVLRDLNPEEWKKLMLEAGAKPTLIEHDLQLASCARIIKKPNNYLINNNHLLNIKKDPMLTDTEIYKHCRLNDKTKKYENYDEQLQKKLIKNTRIMSSSGHLTSITIRDNRNINDLSSLKREENLLLSRRMYRKKSVCEALDSWYRYNLQTCNPNNFINDNNNLL